MNIPVENQNDAKLLSRFAAGDEAAFRTIVSRYKNGLYIFLRRFLNNNELVEDIFQETFLQLFTSRESFDQNRPLRPGFSQSPPTRPKTPCESGSEQRQ